MKSWLAVSFAIPVATAAALSQPHAARAAALTVVNVSAPQVNCVFNAGCKVTVSDSTGNLNFTQYGDKAILQSRTYQGQAGTPGAGTTAYEYRVVLDKAAFTECLAGLVLDFGPVKALPYPVNQTGHVFVTTQGGIGTVGIKDVEQDGSVLTVTFSKFLCPGDSTYFFGLAATGAPQNGTATLFGFGAPPIIQTAARVPQHLAAPAPPQNLQVKP
jgi:spore coat protein U-like protein